MADNHHMWISKMCPSLEIHSIKDQHQWCLGQHRHAITVANQVTTREIAIKSKMTWQLDVDRAVRTPVELAGRQAMDRAVVRAVGRLAGDLSSTWATCSLTKMRSCGWVWPLWKISYDSSNRRLDLQVVQVIMLSSMILYKTTEATSVRQKTDSGQFLVV